MPNYVGGVGSIEPELMIIGEAPGAHEDQQGVPFVGPTGLILNDILSKFGMPRNECYITNVVKYRPPMNDIKKLHLVGIDFADCVRELWENEIERLKPKCILAVGGHALTAVTGHDGILKYRGSILTAKDSVTKVVPTIHPAALFSRTSEEEGFKGGLDWTWLKVIEHDIERAIEESRTRDIILPDRTLDIAYSSLDTYRFFRQYEKLDIASCDIESINCIPVCVGFAFNRHHAISIPLLNKIGKHQFSDMSNRELIEIWRLVDAQLRRLRLVGHNLKYDEFKLNRCGFRFHNVHSDTLIKTRVIFPELPDKSLEVVSSLWTREPYYKSEGSDFKLGKVKPEQFLRYNGKDCAVEFEVDEEQEKDLEEMSERFNVPLKQYYYDYQMRKHNFYLKMENRGFAVDFDRQDELKKKYTEMQAVVHDRLTKKIGRDINVKSNPDVFELLYKEMKFKLRSKAPCSEDAIVGFLEQTKKKDYKEILTDLLEERRIRDQKSRYINFTPDYDDTCKTSYNVIATETCRSSTGILKKPLRPKKLGLSFHTIAAHGRLAKDIKSMFKPRPGKIFLKADASQAEARVVAVLAEDWELLEAFDKVDIHRRTAGLIFAYTKQLILKSSYKDPIVDNLPKDGPERFSGKKVRHAGNYNMGKRRFKTEFNTDAQKFEIPMTISEWRAGQMLEQFHEASPNIRAVFHRDIIECLKSTRTLIDPMGGVRIFNGRMDDETFKEGFANIPQRTVGHLVQGAALKIQDEIGWDNEVGYFIGEKHDELIMEVPENDWEPYHDVLKKHMETPIDFSIYCSLKRNYTLVIPCDVEISNTHYGDFKKAA